MLARSHERCQTRGQEKLLALRIIGTVKCQESCPAPSAVLGVKGPVGLASLLYFKFIVAKKSTRKLKRVLRFRNGPFHDVALVNHSRPLGIRRKKKKKNLVVATWNVRTLIDQNSSK